MTNAQIRKRAWQIFRRRYWSMGALCLLVALASLVSIRLLTSGASVLLPADVEIVNIVPRVIEALVSLVLSPIIWAGAAALALWVWRGQAPSMAVLLCFVKRHSLARKALGLFVLIWLLKALMLLPQAALASYAVLPSALRELSVFVLGLWIEFKLFLCPYLLVTRPELGVRAITAVSWDRMNGNLIRVFCQQLWLWLPVTLIDGAMKAAITYMAFRPNGFDVIPQILLAQTLIAPVMSLLYLGYAQIGMAGLADQLIPPGAAEGVLTEADSSGQDGPETEEDDGEGTTKASQPAHPQEGAGPVP